MRGVKGSPQPAVGLRVGQMLGVDLLCALCVIAVSIAVLGSNAYVPQLKAHFTEVLFLMSANRLAVVEHFAVTGEWATPEPDPERWHGRDSSPWKRQPAASGGRAANGTVVWAGQLKGVDRPFELILRPAVVDGEGSGWTIIWLCGAKETPPGWASPAPAIAAALPDELLLSQCRKGPPS